QTTPDIGLSGAVCTPGVTSSQMVRSSSENDNWQDKKLPADTNKNRAEALFFNLADGKPPLSETT
ncbi:hypothetical protein, partial [Serratia marcescens]|uniref:hypothetical protein n=1 Tax=Serratia marcescens TaxID=615 RepID=UPI003AADAE9A